MKFIIAIISMTSIFSFYAQDKNAIDSVEGVGNYKFGMTQLQCGCTEDKMVRDGWNFCRLSPSLIISGYEVNWVRLWWESEGFNLNIIQVSLGNQDILPIYNKMVIKYGEPNEKQSYSYTWKGDNIQIDLFKRDNDGGIILSYKKIINTEF